MAVQAISSNASNEMQPASRLCVIWCSFSGWWQRAVPSYQAIPGLVFSGTLPQVFYALRTAIDGPQSRNARFEEAPGQKRS